MRIALTIFGSTISPLFDAAQRILLVDIEGAGAQRRIEVSIGELDLAERLWVLTYHKVNVLICGAISGFMHQAFNERGVQVYPWITGEWEEVLRCLERRFTPKVKGKLPQRVAVAADSSSPGAQVASSLRSCTHFLLFDERGEALEMIGHHDRSSFARAGCCAVARLLIDNKVKVLLSGRCGPNALGMFAAAGILAVQGAEGPVEAAIQSYLRGDFTPEHVWGQEPLNLTVERRQSQGLQGNRRPARPGGRRRGRGARKP